MVGEYQSPSTVAQFFSPFDIQAHDADGLHQPQENAERFVDHPSYRFGASLAAGKNCVDIDRIARDIIAGEGYGQFFGHGLGHSLGIDVHEDPRLSPVSQAKLETNLVITVEPGIYVPGLGGVRIENSCVITDTAARSLVSAPRELIIL